MKVVCLAILVVLTACGSGGPPASQHASPTAPAGASASAPRADAGVVAPDAFVFASVTGLGADAPTPSTEKIDGDLDKATIQRVIKTHDKEIRACYEAQLASKPDLEGTLHIQLVIRKNGLVKEVTARGFDGMVEHCVSTELMKVAFPQSARRMFVKDYAITFVKSSS